MPITGAIAIFLATNVVVLPLVWLASSLVLYRRLPSIDEVVLLLVILSIVSPVAIWVYRKKAGEMRASIEDLSYEIRWKNLMMDYTDEIFIVLNMFGQIVAFNRNFEKLVGFPKDELLGRPLRQILDRSFLGKDAHLGYILLDRLRDVFWGNEADFTCPLRDHSTGEMRTVSFRMIPIQKESELQNILVTGRQEPGDSLAGMFLERETSHYVMDNNLALLFTLSYRLTRNLQRYLNRGQVHLVQMALQEVLVNAVEHGNLEIDYDRKTELKKRKGNYWDIVITESNPELLRNRKVHVSYLLDENKVVYTVRDEGRGFDWGKYLGDFPGGIGEQLLESYHGVGLHLVRNVFQVSFNEDGREVTLARYFDRRTA
ncbi:MAG: PAS domain S-box protein [Spirochaetales bacterium]|nr:MAG: PAS domain S-box protein [Spirochaetales bacterium]